MINSQMLASRFPQFSHIDPALIESAIADVEIETNFYAGLGSLALQQQALLLHLAHNLTLIQWAVEGKPGVVKAVRSNNDSMEFAVNNAGYGLESTAYGVRLCALLRRANTVFAVC